MSLRRCRAVVFGASLAILAVAPLRAAIVVPGAFTASEGSSNNGYPFNIGAIGYSSMRYQQVYDKGEFGGSPIVITHLVFRPDSWAGAAYASILPSVQLNLSTTTKAVGGLSLTFSANVGADDTVVRSGALSTASAFAPGAGGSKAFDIVIALSTPFAYNPALGNLLLDVRNYGGGSTTQFDSVAYGGPAVARVWAYNVGSLTGMTGGDSGLVTQFLTGTPPPPTVVPEPGTLALLGLGGLTVLRKRRR